MGRKGFFSHDSADGTSFSKRVRRFYSSDGHRRWAAGENLLWAPDDIGAGSAVAMWMKSRGHRANLLSRRWIDVGIAVVRQPRAPGVFLPPRHRDRDRGFRRSRLVTAAARDAGGARGGRRVEFCFDN